MQLSVPANNPFLMLTDPQAVDRAVQASGRLRSLKRHICRPLDRPLIPRAVPDDLAAYDALIDGAGDSDIDL